ncbi:rCG57342 [Rattus norvegicus]|uniref:RCG57342 n=1 Tax=Rattus norvegicus TaxID=10116 RepID=A6JP81_RAT|nr:rCG57342 [Rattus norvegicus]
MHCPNCGGNPWCALKIVPLTKPRACNAWEAPLSPGIVALSKRKVSTSGNQSDHLPLLITTFLSYFPRLLSHHCWVRVSSTSK